MGTAGAVPSPGYPGAELGHSSVREATICSCFKGLLCQTIFCKLISVCCLLSLVHPYVLSPFQKPSGHCFIFIREVLQEYGVPFPEYLNICLIQKILLLGYWFSRLSSAGGPRGTNKNLSGALDLTKQCCKLDMGKEKQLYSYGKVVPQWGGTQWPGHPVLGLWSFSVPAQRGYRAQGKLFRRRMWMSSSFRTINCSLVPQGEHTRYI